MKQSFIWPKTQGGSLRIYAGHKRSVEREEGFSPGFSHRKKSELRPSPSQVAPHIIV